MVAVPFSPPQRKPPNCPIQLPAKTLGVPKKSVATAFTHCPSSSRTSVARKPPVCPSTSSYAEKSASYVEKIGSSNEKILSAINRLDIECPEPWLNVNGLRIDDDSDSHPSSSPDSVQQEHSTSPRMLDAPACRHAPRIDAPSVDVETAEIMDPLTRHGFDPGLVGYKSAVDLPVTGPALRSSQVLWFIFGAQGEINTSVIELSLHGNGLVLKSVPDPLDAALHERCSGDTATETKASNKDQVILQSIAWSPFVFTHVCGLHSAQADKSNPRRRLFNVCIFHLDVNHFFAIESDNADEDRAQWVADIARVHRVFLMSLFPTAVLCVEPLPFAHHTINRLLAGFMLVRIHETSDFALVFCELRAPCREYRVEFVAYEDETCQKTILGIRLNVSTVVCEPGGIDNSCFKINAFEFAARTCKTKYFWLRAINNVRCKANNSEYNTSPQDLARYRNAIREGMEGYLLQTSNWEQDMFTHKPMLPRQRLEDSGLSSIAHGHDALALRSTENLYGVCPDQLHSKKVDPPPSVGDGEGPPELPCLSGMRLEAGWTDGISLHAQLRYPVAF